MHDRLDIRSYDRPGPPHRHAWPQLVLPLSGRITIDVAGRQADLGTGRIAFVAAGREHSQSGLTANRALIVDLHDRPVPAGILDILAERPFPRIGADTTRRVAAMALAVDGAPAAPSILRHGLPGLLDGLARDAEGPVDRFAALLAAIDADPGGDWSTRRMAQVLGLGSSRLHDVFRARTGTTPHDHLRTTRLHLARSLLTGTALSIASIAGRCGFADQSTLTHAMRRHGGETPAAVRRFRQDAGPSGD